MYIEVYDTEQCLKFADNFDDNDFHPAWSFKNGTWLESSQIMQQISNHYTSNNFLNGCFAMVGSLSWEDYFINCDFLSSDNDVIGFVFNYQDEQNMYMFRWGKQESERILSKFVNGVESILAEHRVKSDLIKLVPSPEEQGVENTTH